MCCTIWSGLQCCYSLVLLSLLLFLLAAACSVWQTLHKNVVLEGANTPVSSSSHLMHHCRCTRCDLDVLFFDELSWAPDCDYLFFRNNYPTAEKLAPKQVPLRGSTAYCCQCSWRTVSGADPLKVDAYAGDLHWVCRGHGWMQP
jgi:hypothetical protein